MIEVQPLTVADVPAKCRVEMEAFASHPRMPIMWPRGMTPDLYAYHESGDIKSLGDPNCRMFKATESGSSQLVGSASWTLSLNPDAPVTKTEISANDPPPENWPKDGNWAIRAFYRNNINKLLKQYMSGQRYILLNFLTVAPGFQGRGIGARLLQWGIEEADERGIAMCLEATPIGLALYKKNGFREVEVIAADMRDFGWTEPYDERAADRIFMIRDARSK